MRRTRQTRAWWTETVARWQRSGVPAGAFAEREGLVESTLRWWSAELSRATRAEHGSTAIAPIEIAVPAERAERANRAGTIEIAAVGVVVRIEVGADVSYVAALVRAFEGR